MTAARPLPRDLVPTAARVRWVRYRDLVQLRSTLQALERAAAPDLVATLILDEWFAGRLSSIVRRRRPGRALVVTTASGQASRVELGDWPEIAAELGWQRVLMDPAPERALRRAAELARGNQPVVVLAPAGVAATTPSPWQRCAR